MLSLRGLVFTIVASSATVRAPLPMPQPCSAFALSADDEVWLAKNFDWHFDGGYLIKNPTGVARQALPLFGGEPASWTAAYGSLTFTQYGVGLPYGGINQRGLAIEMLWLDETVYPAKAPRSIGELEWIQYQLDTRATVAEVIASLDEFSIRPLAGKIHYMLADATGDRALVEFIDGAARVQRGGDAPLVCTNDTHRLSELAFDKLRGTNPRGNSSRVRYARLRLDLEALDARRSSAEPKAPLTVATAFAALAKVAERGSPYRTQWATVYEVRRGRVHVRPDRSERAFTIDATALDYSPASGTTFQDLFTAQPGERKFAPLSGSANLALITRNLPKVGLGSQLEAIANHLLAPAPSTVGLLEDRATLRVLVRAKAPGAFARIAVFRSPAELASQRAATVGSVLLDTAQREFAFYNLPLGRCAVGAFHDHNQNGRPDQGEPLSFFRPDANVVGTDFDDLAFELTSSRVVEVGFD